MSVKINIGNNLEDVLKSKRPTIGYTAEGDVIAIAPLNARLDFSVVPKFQKESYTRRENYFRREKDDIYVCVK